MEDIYALIRIKPKLEDYCEKTDRALEQTALDTRRETMVLAEEMERLIELKRQLVNLAVICREVERRLSEKETVVLTCAASGITLTETGISLGVSCSTAARLTVRVKNKCEKLLGQYDIERYRNLLERFRKK